MGKDANELDELLAEAETALRSIVAMDDEDEGDDGESMTCADIADRIKAFRRKHATGFVLPYQLASEKERLELVYLAKSPAPIWKMVPPGRDQTLDKWKQKGWATWVDKGWTITDAGRAALAEQPQ